MPPRRPLSSRARRAAVCAVLALAAHAAQAAAPAAGGAAWPYLAGACAVLAAAAGWRMRRLAAALRAAEQRALAAAPAAPLTLATCPADAATCLHAFLDAAPDAMLLAGRDGTIRYANGNGARCLGCTAAELTGLPLEQLLPQALEAGSGAGRVLTARRRDGSSFPARVSLAPLRMGGQDYSVVSLRDLTQRQRAEEALHASSERYRLIVQTAAEGIWTTDAAGLTSFVNPKLAQMLGYTVEQMLGRALGDFMDPADYRQLEQHLRRRRPGQPGHGDFRFFRQDRSSLWALLSTTPLEAAGGAPGGTLVMLTDITERRLAAVALRHSNQRMASVFNAVTSGLLVQDSAGNILESNAAAVRLLAGVGRASPWPAVREDGSAFEAASHPVQIALRSGAAVRDVVMGVRQADGALCWLSVNTEAIRDEQGAVCMVVSSLTDISGRKRSEDALRELNEHLEERVAKRTEQLGRAKLLAEQASLAKGRFLANMSHEIRTPMNGVIGMAYLALKTGPEPRLRDYLEKIRYAGEHLRGVIDDILDFSKIEAGKLDLECVDFSLAQLMQTLQTMAAPRTAGPQRKLVFELDPALPPLLRGDPLRLGQVLINYTNNAVKFSSEGEITVRARRLDGPGCMVRFEVQDHGIGLSEAEIGKLFQSFQQADASTTREYGGSGLGLAICKQLAQLMGGAVGVDSRPGAGSTFWFTAHLEPGAAAAGPEAAGGAGAKAEAEAEAAACAALARARILLVEDNPFNQQIALEMLEQAGASVCLANNGIEALDLLRQADFDCVLMDVQMPLMDGLEATRRIRADSRLAGLRVLAMTATATSEDRARCSAAGMDGFLSKPVQPGALYRSIAAWLPEPQLQPAAQPPAGPPDWRGSLAGDPQIIDLSILAKLLAYDPHKVRKFAFKFLHSTQDGLAEMDAALARGEIQPLRELGHRIKSAARTVGALGMAELCQSLEHLPLAEPAQEAARAAAIVAQLWPLLESVSEQIISHTGFADDD